MARSFFTDPLMACNFALMEVPLAGAAPLAFGFKAIRSAISQGNFVGFQSMTVPEISLETREIKQGNWPHIHNVITGFASGGNITLNQAVLPEALDMYAWWLQAVNGLIGPRRNLILTHTRLDRALPARILSCQSCIPVSWKMASDFDSSASEVSVESLTLWTQKVDIIIVPPVPISRSDLPQGIEGV